MQREPYSLQWVLSVFNGQTQHSNYALLFIIRACSLQRDPFSLQRVLSTSKVHKAELTRSINFQETLGFPQYKQQTIKVPLCCIYKTGLTSFSEVSFFHLWNAPHLWYNWRGLNNFLQQDSIIDVYANIVINTQISLDLLKHAFIKTTPSYSF